MNQKTLKLLEHELRRQREALFNEVADTEADLQALTERRESELEEQAQENRLARLLDRLDERGKREIEDIDFALARIADGSYGTCTRCGRKMSAARLKALPATRLCLPCAQHEERGEPPAGQEAEETPSESELPADLNLLRDSELEQLIRDRVREDKRIDSDELRIVCRHGVVYLNGALPSELEHSILRRMIEDVLGLKEVVDRIQVKELLWEREDRSKEEPEEERTLWSEERGTEDVVKSVEEGVEYEAPDEPIPEEE